MHQKQGDKDLLVSLIANSLHTGRVDSDTETGKITVPEDGVLAGARCTSVVNFDHGAVRAGMKLLA